MISRGIGPFLWRPAKKNRDSPRATGPSVAVPNFFVAILFLAHRLQYVYAVGRGPGETGERPQDMPTGPVLRRGQVTSHRTEKSASLR